VCVLTVKARRKTATAEDLLFAGASDGSHLSAAVVSPLIMPGRAVASVVDSMRSAAMAQPGSSPPERDSSRSPRTASGRVSRSCPTVALSHAVYYPCISV